MPIIIALYDDSKRFNERQRCVIGISAKLLSSELKELEMNGFIKRNCADDAFGYPSSCQAAGTNGRSIQMNRLGFIRQKIVVKQRFHWHGAAPDREVSHIAIGTNSRKGAVVWLKPVSAKEYNKP